MARIEFNFSDADYITLKFKCNCGKVLETDLIPVKRHFNVRKNINSFSHDVPIVCEQCCSNHIIDFYEDLCSCPPYCEIKTLDSDDSIIYLHEIPAEYAENYNTALLDYTKELSLIKDFIEKYKDSNRNENFLLNKMVFVYLVSVMDAYLGNTFRYNVNEHEVFKNNFLLYKKDKKKALERLESKSFQNLKETTIPYYQKFLGISIPPNEIIQNAIKIRNGISHNFSRGKDGYEHPISMRQIEELLIEIQKLVTFVHQEIMNIVYKKIILKNR